MWTHVHVLVPHSLRHAVGVFVPCACVLRIYWNSNGRDKCVVIEIIQHCCYECIYARLKPYSYFIHSTVNNTPVYTLILLCYCYAGVAWYFSTQKWMRSILLWNTSIAFWNQFEIALPFRFAFYSQKYQATFLALMNSLFWIAIESVHLIWFLNEFNCFSHILKLSFSNLDTLKWAKTDFFWF